MANHAKRAVQSTRGLHYDTRHGWVPKEEHAPTPSPHDDVAYSVAGLGAFTKYRSHPGRIFPGRALTVKLSDKGRQNIHAYRAFGNGTARPLRTSSGHNTVTRDGVNIASRPTH